MLFFSEYSEFGPSSKNDPIITFQVVKQQSVKEMSIPRKIPTNIIRKPVHTSDAGYKEIAIMGTLILVLNVLGVCLYWLVNKFSNFQLSVERN